MPLASCERIPRIIAALVSGQSLIVVFIVSISLCCLRQAKNTTLKWERKKKLHLFCIFSCAPCGI
jgi:hypothetical protein